VRFEEYVIVPLQDLGGHVEECEERHADFWGLYGIDRNDDAYAVGDFCKKSDAKLIRDAIQAS